MTYPLSLVPMRTPLPAVLGVLRREYPAIQPQIHLDTPREIERGAVEGRYDIAISGMHLNAKGVEIFRLYDMNMYLYCSKGHRLFNMPDELVDDELLRQFDTIMNVYDTQNQKPFDANDCVTSEASEVSIFFILSGMYIGYLSEFVASPWVATGELRALRPAIYFYPAPAGLILPERSATNPAVRKTVELLRRFASSNSDVP